MATPAYFRLFGGPRIKFNRPSGIRRTGMSGENLWSNGLRHSSNYTVHAERPIRRKAQFRSCLHQEIESETPGLSHKLSGPQAVAKGRDG